MTGPLHLPRRAVPIPAALALLGLLGGTCAPSARADESAPSSPPLVEGAPNELAAAKGYLIAGIGNRPEYTGAAVRRSSPFFISRFRLPRAEISLEGLDWYLDVLPSRVWRAGPSVSFELPRDASVASGPVAALPPLGLTSSPGLYAGFELPNRLLPEGLASARVAWRHALGGGREGNALSLDADYFFAPLFFWRVGVAANAVFVDDAWAHAGFGIDRAGADASGLPAHVARGGAYSFGASFYTILSVSQRFGVFGRWAVATLRGGAAASPIVADEGRANQRFSGIGLFYLFR